jgi:hypothetical protein
MAVESEDDPEDENPSEFQETARRIIAEDFEALDELDE